MKKYSLKKKLLFWVSTPILITILINLFVGYKTIRHEINEVYDANLVNAAKVIFELSKQELKANNLSNFEVDSPRFSHRYRNKVEFIIWKNEQVVLSSLPSRALSRHNINSRLGFSNQKIGKSIFRSFIFASSKDNVKVHVLERVDDRNELIFELLAVLILPIIFLILLISFIIYFAIHIALKPIVNLSNDIDQRNSDDLSAIDKKKLPKEVIPLIAAINRLFKRITKTLKAEREFTDHAAHELRTPLAAMKTQTQVLIRKNKFKNDNIKDLENLESSINRITHLVEQLLLLSRLQNQKFIHQPVNLSELLNHCLDHLKISLDEKNINLNKQIYDNLIVKGNSDAISILLNNLLINSIKYTANSGLIDVSLNKNGKLIIKDTGVGIKDKDKKIVFNRFVRKDNSGQAGSGLGLSIAKSIAKNHQVTIKLKNNKPKGLVVSIQWKPCN